MDISTRTILKVLGTTAAFVGALMLAYMVRRELTWIGIAFFLAIALNPAVDYLTRFMPKRSRGLAIGSVFALILALLAFLIVSFLPPLVTQTESLTKNLPGYTDSLIHGHGLISDIIRQYDLVDRIRNA